MQIVDGKEEKKMGAGTREQGTEKKARAGSRQTECGNSKTLE